MDFNPGSLWILGVLAGFFFALLMMRVTRCENCCQVQDDAEDDTDPEYWKKTLGRRSSDRGTR